LANSFWASFAGVLETTVIRELFTKPDSHEAVKAYHRWRGLIVVADFERRMTADDEFDPVVRLAFKTNAVFVRRPSVLCARLGGPNDDSVCHSLLKERSEQGHCEVLRE
jgi:hypothetical protein